MKKFILASAIFLTAAITLCAAPEHWQTDYDAAVKEAQKTKKTVLVLFTGSDWCPGCIALNEHALSKPEFLEFAKKKSGVSLYGFTALCQTERKRAG